MARSVDDDFSIVRLTARVLSRILARPAKYVQEAHPIEYQRVLFRAIDSPVSQKNLLRTQPAKVKDAWIASLLDDPQAAVRREMIAEFQKSRSGPA